MNLKELFQNQDQTRYRIELIIDGKTIDVTSGVEEFEIQQAITNAAGKCMLKIRWLDRKKNPKAGKPEDDFEEEVENLEPRRDEVKIYRITGPRDPLIFHGKVDFDPTTIYGREKALEITARDFGAEVLCATTWYARSGADIKVADYVAGLFADFPPGWISQIEDSGATLQNFRADGISLFAALQRLALYSGEDFYFGPGRSFVWFDPATRVKPYSLTTRWPTPTIVKGGVNLGWDSARIRNFIWGESQGYPVDNWHEIHGDGFTSYWLIPDEVRPNDQYGGVPEAIYAEIWDPLKGKILETWVGFEGTNITEGAVNFSTAWVVQPPPLYTRWITTILPPGEQQYRLVMTPDKRAIKSIAPLPKSFRIRFRVPTQWKTTESVYNQESIDEYGTSTYILPSDQQFYAETTKKIAENILRRFRRPELKGEVVSFDWRPQLGDTITVDLPEKGILTQAQITEVREGKKFREPPYRIYGFGSRLDGDNSIQANFSKIYTRLNDQDTEAVQANRALQGSTEVEF